MTEAQLPNPNPGGKPSVLFNEAAWTGALLALFLLVNLLTAARSPTVWDDEVLIADPAARFLSGHGFTSTAWNVQTSRELWAGTAPLDLWLLVPWIKLWGLSPTAVRSINYVYTATAVLLLALAVRRSGWIADPRWRVGLIGMVLCEYSVVFSYRSGRYDMICFLLAAALAAAATLPVGRKRAVVLAALAFWVPFAGLSLIPFLMVVSLVLLCLGGIGTLRLILPMGLGVIAGGGALWLLWHGLGVWDRFETSVLLLSKVHNDGGLHRLLSAGMQPLATAFQDPSLLLLLGALAAGLTAQAQIQTKEWPGTISGRGIIGCLALALTAPFFLKLSGQFPIYYGWMAAVPAAVGVAALLAQAPAPGGGSIGSIGSVRDRARLIAMVLAGLAVASGLPARLAVTGWEWQARDYAPVEKFVGDHLTPEDRVAADHPAFYALQHRGIEAYYPYYLYRLTPAEREGCTALLVAPESLPLFQKVIGGKWEKVAEMGAKPDALSRPTRARLYDLALYRRVAAPSP